MAPEEDSFYLFDLSVVKNFVEVSKYRGRRQGRAWGWGWGPFDRPAFGKQFALEPSSLCRLPGLQILSGS